MFDRPLNIKVRKVDPYKRMQQTHPFYIWQVLMRFRTMDKLTGQEGLYRPPADIARQLFSNFDELRKIDQDIVISCKLSLAISCLRTNYLVEERTEKVRNPAYFEVTSARWDPTQRKEIDKPLGEYRARAGAFGDIVGVDIATRQQWTADSIDANWRLWTGQPSKYERAERWLKKRGLLDA